MSGGGERRAPSVFDPFESMMRQLQQPGGVERMMERERERQQQREEELERSLYKDDQVCDAVGCNEPAKEKKCSRCQTKFYCSKECQTKAWKDDGHKDECKHLRACQRVPLAKLPEIMEMEGSGHTCVGFASTQHHGTHFFVMEKYEEYGNESNRLVVLADTNDISERGILSCIVEACLHPSYDTHNGSGSRRPASIKIYVDTFPDNNNNPLVDLVGKTYSRFGSKPRIQPFDEFEDGSWEFSWFCCHHGWLEEITDEFFLKAIEASRRRPLPPNGMARRGMQKRDKDVQRLDPTKYPTVDTILKLPFDNKQMVVVAGTDGTVYVMNPDNGTLYYRKKLRLAKNRRPHVQDVLLCLYKAISKHGKRPESIAIGQPSICNLRDIDNYEDALDNTVCKEMCMLAMQDWAESSLKKQWLPHWRNTGQYDRAGDD